MKMFTLLSIATLLGGVSVSLEAQAQYTCTSGTCYYWANTVSGNAISGSATSGTGITGTGSVYGVEATGSGTSSYGLYATATGLGSVGASGESPTLGVYGSASGNSGIGVEGATSQTNGNGVVGLWGTGTVSTSNSESGVYGSTSGNFGVVGVNSSTGSTTAGVWGSGNTGGTFTGVANGIYADCTGTGCYAGYFDGNVEVVSGYSYYYNGTHCVGGSCTSDQRLKRNIEPLKGAMSQLLSLRGVTFEWIDPQQHGGDASVQTGFIAQEVEKVFPDWVDQHRDGMKGIALPPMHIAALEVESIRELYTENVELRARTAKLEERLDALQNGRDPMTGGIGFGRGMLCLVGLGVAGLFGLSRRKSRATL
jgi:hypothetical protein